MYVQQAAAQKSLCSRGIVFCYYCALSATALTCFFKAGAVSYTSPPLSAPPSLSFLAADDFILTCLTRYCSLLFSINSKMCLCPDEVSVLDVEDERRGALDMIGDNENLTQDSIAISNYDNSISVGNHVH